MVDSDATSIQDLVSHVCEQARIRGQSGEPMAEASTKTIKPVITVFISSALYRKFLSRHRTCTIYINSYNRQLHAVMKRGNIGRETGCSRR